MPTMTKSPAAKARTKSQVMGEIADQTGLTRKETASVFETMAALIKKDLGRRGPGVFTVPGLMKVRVGRPGMSRGSVGRRPRTGSAR